MTSLSVPIPRIRDAVAADDFDLAAAAVMAGHGIMTLLYEGLVPGMSMQEAIVARRIRDENSFGARRRWRVAVDQAGQVLGALNSFPHEVLANAPADPLMDRSRIGPIDALSALEAGGAGSYYINIIAVFPERRRGGTGRALMAEGERLARAEGIRRLSLCAFEGDAGLMTFYHKSGFQTVARCPIVPHPTFELGGHWALMVRDLA